MRKPLLALVPVLLVAAQATWAGTADVRFENADRYTDAGRGRQAESVQKTLAAALQALAGKGLPDSQTLTITVTDIDLAGEIPPGAVRLTEVRVMGRHPDWPRISLRYSLREGDRVLAEGSETVTDMAYLMRGGLLSGSNDLPYERRMLGTWFNERFGQHTAH